MRCEYTVEELGGKVVEPGYYGITYPRVLGNNVVRWCWKRIFCRCGWHLWDEVWPCHSLSCDACDLEVEIDRIVEWPSAEEHVPGACKCGCGG